MKKLVLIVSLIISFLLCETNIQIAHAESEQVQSECNDISRAKVQIINTYGAFLGNGFVYKVEEEYAYIITSKNISFNEKNSAIIYSNGFKEESSLVGEDSYYNIRVLKAKKNDYVKGVCLANSIYSMEGHLVIASGYKDINNNYFEKIAFNKKGVNVYKKDYLMVFKSIIQTKYETYKEGMGVVDELGNLIGMISKNEEKLSNTSFIIETNKLTKIADSIMKTRNYNINYIKYNLEDYGSIDETSLENYKVHKNATYGVVITTFKPLNYVFGGLNQGMVIQAVNSIKVENLYELDLQLTRYEKDDIVCLNVLKKNGKIAYYYVKI